MSRILQDFAQAVDEISERRASYNTKGAQPRTQVNETRLEEIHSLIHRPAFSLSDLPAYLDAIKNSASAGLDDRELLLEKVLVLMSRLQNTEISTKIQQIAIGLLYKDLPHPASGFLSAPPVPQSLMLQGLRNEKGQPTRYAYRTADGSNYNVSFPTMGMAGSPYARSVPSTSFIPVAALPDPGLVYDTLLRREKFEPHPDGISALFFSFADLVIHSIFDTDHNDWTINKTSSYLDLSILYGSSEEKIRTVRRSDGSGELYDDTFADYRLLFMPPAACALLVLLSRNHNYIARRLLDINEKGNFVSLDKLTNETCPIQDDELFHRARLINTGYFMHIILGDYVGAILGLVRDGSDWRLDPLMPIRDSNHELTPRGEGNAVSVEFNLLYRWHATLSEEDTKWTEEQFKEIFKDTPPEDITIDLFNRSVGQFSAKLPKDPREWTFGGINRRASDGRFSDDDLAGIIQDSTERRAGAFQARGTPRVLRIVEIMGIEQARSWGVCTMNEFRKFMGLRPYSTFEEWNPDPSVAQTAQMLYKDINHLELYVGLQAEQAKKPGPGAGLCPGYTISRAILADAVCLTRGDRFLTTELTPYNLTSWGFQDCQYDKKDGSYGGLLTKLLFRTLPNHYPAGSAYAHFPFTVPKVMKKNMANDPKIRSQTNKYTWDRPILSKKIVKVEDYAGAKHVLLQPNDFVPRYTELTFDIVQHLLIKESILQGSDIVSRETAIKAAKEAFIQGKAVVNKIVHLNKRKIADYFVNKVSELLDSKSFKHVGHSMQYVDLIKDVLNLAPIHWAAQEVTGLSLKTRTNEKGQYYEQHVYDAFGDVGRYVFVNYETTETWRLRENATHAIDIVYEGVKEHLKYIESTVRSSMLKTFNSEKRRSHEFLKAVRDAGSKWSDEQIAAYIFAEVVPTLSFFSQTLAHVVNHLLDDVHKADREAIAMLCTSLENDSSNRILACINEALRVDPPISAVHRVATKDVDTPHIKVKAGEEIFVNIATANKDADLFGESNRISYTRTAERAGLVALGDAGGLLDSSLFQEIAPRVLGIILNLPNLSRGPGQSGQLTRFKEHWQHIPRQLYVNSKGRLVPWPDSLVIQFDAKTNGVKATETRTSEFKQKK